MWNKRFSWRCQIISFLTFILIFFVAITVRTYGFPATLTLRKSQYRHKPSVSPLTLSLPDLTSNTSTQTQGSFIDDEPSWTVKTGLRGSFDIVVSYYNENLTDVASQLEAIKVIQQLRQYNETRIFVYTKNENADLVLIQDLLRANHVSLLPNRGREAGTYLSHIVQNWDDLGSHTMFIQAAMHFPGEAIKRVEQSLVPPHNDGGPSTGMLTMGFIAGCQCTSCHDGWDPGQIWSRIPEIYVLLNHELCPKDIVLTYLGQMVVSRKRIWKRRIETYQYLKDMLESDLDHWIHTDGRNDGGPYDFHDTPENPFFGHTFERIWMVLWDCNDTKLLETCGNGLHSLLNPREPDDPVSSCQCLDE
jgi:hypothetical protein